MSQNSAAGGRNVASGWALPFARTRWAIIGFVAGVFTWSFAGGGQQHPETDPEVVEAPEGPVGTFDKSVRRVKEGVRRATSSVRDRITDAQESANNSNLEAKVEDRLSKETSIDDDRIEVQVKDEGTIVLRGQVPDKDSKEKVVDVTRDTKGVRRIEDHLSVPPRERVFAVKPDPDAAPPQSRRRR